jgi:hypothetical protein
VLDIRSGPEGTRSCFYPVYRLLRGGPDDRGWVEAGQPGYNLLQVALIYLVEGVVLVAIYVKDGNELSGLIEDRHHDFALGVGITGNMAGEPVDFRYDDRLPAPGAGTTHAPIEGDMQAAQRALEWTDEEAIWPHPSVKAGPEVAVKGLVQKTDDGNHRGQEVRLALQDGLDLLDCSFVGGSFLLAIHAYAFRMTKIRSNLVVLVLRRERRSSGIRSS